MCSLKSVPRKSSSLESSKVHVEELVPKVVLSLVPHVIEDFYRLRRRFRGKVLRQDRLWHSAKCNNKLRNLNCKLYSRTVEISICTENAIAIPSKRATTGSSLLEGTCAPLKKQIGFYNMKEQNKRHLTNCKTTAQMNNLNSDKRSNNKFETNIALQNMRRQPDYVEVYKYCDERRHVQKENKAKEFYERMSKPKSTNFDTFIPSWKLTKSMKNFVPSNRLQQMAQPKGNNTPSLTLSGILKVKKAALHYQASERIKELAAPQGVPEKPSSDPYKVRRHALRANISERVAELALPKNRIDRITRKYPYKVRRRALYARTTKHIKELARPKVIQNFQLYV